MRFDWIATCLALTLIAGPVSATDQKQKEESAENKAEVLEQKAAENKKPATEPKVEAITPSEVQAVDPAGAAPLDDAITCLARSIYWEAKGKDSADM
jgi:spore germination cell wall hydrolase CwlJ-like protein